MSTAQQQQGKQGQYGEALSIRQLVGRMTPEEFADWNSKTLAASTEIISAVTELVSDHKLMPIQGAGVIACTQGQLFGYQEFHTVDPPGLLNPVGLKRQQN